MTEASKPLSPVEAMAKAYWEEENGFGAWDLVSEVSQRKLCRSMERATSSLLAENARLQALVDGRFKDEAQMVLKHLELCDGSFDLAAQAPIVMVMVEHLAEAFKAMGGDNYVCLEMNHDELGPMILSIQRRFGEMPASKAARLEADNTRLREALEPFAAFAKVFADHIDASEDDPFPDDWQICARFACIITLGHFRRARAALSSVPRLSKDLVQTHAGITVRSPEN